MPGDGSSSVTRAPGVVVDGDGAMRRLLRRALDQFGCDCYEAQEGLAMLGVLRNVVMAAMERWNCSPCQYGRGNAPSSETMRAFGEGE